jgi:hypothetical protein
VKRLVEFPLENQPGTLVVEIEEPEREGGMERAGRREEVTELARQSFESALEKMRPLAATVIGKLKGSIHVPAEIGVEFGLKLNAQAGVILAASGIEANFKVSLKWTNAPAKDEHS